MAYSGGMGKWYRKNKQPTSLIKYIEKKILITKTEKR